MVSLSNPFWQGAGDHDAPCLITPEATLSKAAVLSIADGLYEGRRRGVAAILCARDVATVTGYVGALRQGVVPLMLDAALPQAALTRALEAYAPDYVLGGDHAPEGYRQDCSHQGTPFFVRDAAASGSDDLHPDLALLLLTSGSTGDPKSVRISFGALEAASRAIASYLEMNAGRRTISLLPLNYSYGLSVLNITLASGGAMVLSEHSVLSREFWGEVETHGVTDISGVPFTFETLRRMRFSDALLKQLACVTQAGGRLDPKLTRHFRRLFGDAGVKYFTMYGQTEASPRIAYLPPEMAEAKEGSVGRSLDIGSAEIAETGQPIGEGELLYRGPNVAMGYARTRADLALGDEFQGALHTGDRVRIDAEGYITIIGRRARFIKVHGLSVNLDDLEAIAAGAGHDCLVIGRENRVLVLHEAEDEDALRDTFEAQVGFHLSALKFKKIESLPRVSSGKLDYKSAAETYL